MSLRCQKLTTMLMRSPLLTTPCCHKGHVICVMAYPCTGWIGITIKVAKHYLSIDMQKACIMIRKQHKLKLACASAQSDQSLCCSHAIRIAIQWNQRAQNEGLSIQDCMIYISCSQTRYATILRDAAFSFHCSA